MKNKLKAFFKHWPLYIVSICLASFITCAGISIKCKPSDREKIMVFAASGTIDVAKTVSYSKYACDDSIREIEVKHGYTNLDTTIRLFGMVYSLCDFYIFPESWIEKIEPLAATFDEETINALIPNSENLNLYLGESGYCGIEIYNKDTKEGCLKSLISYEYEKDNENYYILFRKTSYHIGSLNNSESSNALNVVNSLLML